MSEQSDAYARSRRVQAPLSPMEIEVKMAQVMNNLEDAVTLQQALADVSAEKRHAFKMAEAQKTLEARVLDFADGAGKPSVAEKAAWVYQQCGDLELAFKIAEGQLDAQKSVVRSLQSEAEILRSLSRSARDLVEGPGYGGGGRGRD